MFYMSCCLVIYCLLYFNTFCEEEREKMKELPKERKFWGKKTKLYYTPDDSGSSGDFLFLLFSP